MTKHCATALIVAGPGSLQSGLQALMTAMPQIKIVGQTHDAALALKMVADHHPDLVLVDANSPGQVGTTLKQIRKESSHTRSIVLVEDAHQQQQVEAIGADIVLLKGFPAAKLIATIESVCPSRECQEKRDVPENFDRTRR
jgi:DNA-binding NarL/FixJ family response regulator